MDKNVLAAMARWPDVPDVFGWLSLSERGEWRLHPDADAATAPARSGEPIDSVQIRQFIDHNYACDAQGRWYFQNGPQCVFVRLDAAPYILHTIGPGPALQLQTHNGLRVDAISGWWLDDTGRLYAQTEHGPGLIAGRDAMAVLDSLYALHEKPVTAVLEKNPTPSQPLALSGVKPVLLSFCSRTAIPAVLDFVLCPTAA